MGYATHAVRRVSKWNDKVKIKKSRKFQILFFFSSTEPLTPQNLAVRRTSPTTIQVTWDESTQENLIAMYRVFYFTLVSDDMTMWDYIDTDGPTTVAQITGLQAHMTYVIRVQAKSVNERWSNMTEVKIADFTSQGICLFV